MLRSFFSLHVSLFSQWAAPSMHWCVKIYWAVSSSVTLRTSADSSLSAQLWEALTDPKVQSEGCRAFSQLNTTSLCVQLTDHCCRKRRMGQQSPPELSGSGPRMPVQPSDTCGGLWMSLWWDWGTGMVMNTQSFISHPWHCSHSDTDTHWDTKPQLPQVADLHTTLGINATQLHLALKETPCHSGQSASLYIPLHGCTHNGQKWIHHVFKGKK